MMWAGALLYLVPLAVIAVIDIRTRRAPNRLVLPLIAVGVLVSVTAYREHALDALAGGVVAFAVLLLIAALGRGRMGMGDVKYGSVCGMAVGVQAALPMLAFAFITGAVLAAVVMALRIRHGSEAVAFTPFLYAGVLFALGWYQPYLVS